MKPTRILVAIHDTALANVLIGWLEHAFPADYVVHGALEDVHVGDVVLVTRSDCEPTGAAEMIGLGARLILLAPVPRQAERELYLRAGAEYVPMSIDNVGLLEALAASKNYLEPVELRAVCNHRLSAKCSA